MAMPGQYNNVVPVMEGPFSGSPTGGGGSVNPTGANSMGGITPAWGGDRGPAPVWGSAPIWESGNWNFNSGTGPGPVTGTSSPTGGPGNYGYGSSGNPNPTGPPSMFPGGTATPGGGPAGPGGTTGGLGFSGTNWQSFGNELGKIYGKGVGSELYGFLDSGGGYNSALTDQAVQDQLAQMNRAAGIGFGNLESNFGASGVSPDSSVAALGGSNYWADVTSSENAMISQEFYNMWNESMNRETGILGDVLGSASQYKSSQPSLWSFLQSGAQGAGSAAEFALMAGA